MVVAIQNALIALLQTVIRLNISTNTSGLANYENLTYSQQFDIVKQNQIHVARRNQFPWQVSLVNIKRGEWHHICGGTIIKQCKVLTAAHCVTSQNKPLPRFRLAILSGSTHHEIAGSAANAMISRLSQIIVHDQWNREKFDYDFAVLITRQKFPFGQPNFAPLQLSKRSSLPDVDCVVSGWGRVANEEKPVELRYAYVSVLTDLDCGIRTFGSANRPWKLCGTGGSTVAPVTSAGDSGGPLVCGQELVGVVSYGLEDAPLAPDVYGRVSSVWPWIESNKAGQIHLSATGGMALIIVLFFLIHYL